MRNATSLTTLQTVLAIVIGIWAVVGIILILESENSENKPQTRSGFDWMRKCAPRWYKRLTYWVALPLFIVLLFSRSFGL